MALICEICGKEIILESKKPGKVQRKCTLCANSRKKGNRTRKSKWE
jgi:hypothetical protein